MPFRPCSVSFTDVDGLRRSVEVQAESVYEAAILALKILQAHECSPAPHTRIEIEIRMAMTHTVTVKRIRDWLKRSRKG